MVLTSAVAFLVEYNGVFAHPKTLGAQDAGRIVQARDYSVGS